MKSMVVQLGSNDKPRLRSDYLGRLQVLSPQQRAAQSTRLSDLLSVWAKNQGFLVVLATLALNDEPDLTTFFEDWLKTGQRLGLARMAPNRQMSFRFVETLEGPWNTREWGLREPTAAGEVWSPGPSTLCLVPGLAFSACAGGRTMRLGRGGGYYDRWLGVHESHVFALGVGFSVQEADSLPTEPHDRDLRGWVSPSGFHGI